MRRYWKLSSLDTRHWAIPLYVSFSGRDLDIHLFCFGLALRLPEWCSVQRDYSLTLCGGLQSVLVLTPFKWSLLSSIQWHGDYIRCVRVLCFELITDSEDDHANLAVIVS